MEKYDFLIKIKPTALSGSSASYFEPLLDHIRLLPTLNRFRFVQGQEFTVNRPFPVITLLWDKLDWEQLYHFFLLLAIYRGHLERGSLGRNTTWLKNLGFWKSMNDWEISIFSSLWEKVAARKGIT